MVGRLLTLMIPVVVLMAPTACSSGAGTGPAEGSAGEAAEVVESEETATTTAGALSTDSDGATVGADDLGTVQPDAGGGPSSAGQGCESAGDPVASVTVEAAGFEYPVRVHRPPSAVGRSATVINWHGLGSDGLQQALLTDYESLAAAEGFVVVHPTGAASADDVQRGWELDQFDAPGRDDLAFFDALVDVLVDEFCADPTRIYSTGMSNGGFFTSRLVCERADRIAAAVAVAGISHYDGCEPTRPVPFLALHGTADAVVPFDGGASSLAGPNPPAAVSAFFDQVMPDEFAQFAAAAGCDPDPTDTAVGDGIVRYEYRSCDDGIEMTFVEIVGGGHTWPGSALGALMAEFLGPTTSEISATVDGWRFMSRHTLDGPTG